MPFVRSSSLDLEQTQPCTTTSTSLKSNLSKVRRLYNKNIKPYAFGKPRRYSLQLGVHREEGSTLHDCNLNRGLNLSDSEASSGSGTGTPPPPHADSTLGLGCAVKRPFQLNFKEVKSNPSSPSKSGYAGGGFMLTAGALGMAQSSYLPATCSEESQLLTLNQCGAGNGNGGQPFLTRSKSLDDLTALLNLQEDPDYLRQQLKLFPPNPTLLRQLERRIASSRFATGAHSDSPCDIIENVLQRISRLEM